MNIRIYLHSAAGTDGAMYERWDTGRLPDAPVPTLTDLGQLDPTTTDAQQFITDDDMRSYAEARGETLHEVQSAQQAIRVIRGDEPIPAADSNFNWTWIAAAGAAAFLFLRR